MRRDRVCLGIVAILAWMSIGNSFSVRAVNGYPELVHSLTYAGGPLTITKTFVEKEGSRSLYDYKISVKTSEISSGATGVVLGKTAYAELRTGAGSGTLVKSSNSTATNLKNLDTQLAKMGNESIVSGSTAAITVETGATVKDENGIDKTTYTVKANTGDIGSGLGTLVTGGTLYNEVHLSENGNYIQASKKTGENLKLLDTQIETNRVQIFDKNKADIENLTNLDEATVTDAGKSVLKGLVKDGVQVAAGNESITVTHEDNADGNRTYTISAQTGEVAKGSNQLVTGGTVYKELLLEDRSFNYLQPTDNTAGNIMTLDAQVKTNADNITALDQRVGNKISVLSGDLNQVAANAAALAALRPEPFDPDDKWSFAVGYGHYRNRNAAAVGIYLKPDADTTISLGGTVWSGDPMLNMSTSFKLGSRGKAVKSPTNAKLNRLAKRIKALEEIDAKQNKAINGSLQRINKMEGARVSQNSRLAYLEADGQMWRERHQRQMAVVTEAAQETEKLKVEEKGLIVGYANLKEETVKIKGQITAALAQVKLSQGK